MARPTGLSPLALVTLDQTDFELPSTSVFGNAAIIHSLLRGLTLTTLEIWSKGLSFIAIGRYCDRANRTYRSSKETDGERHLAPVLPPEAWLDYQVVAGRKLTCSVHLGRIAIQDGASVFRSRPDSERFTQVEEDERPHAKGAHERLNDDVTITRD
ncbi:hypothetical protein N7539_002223 [Penicillium diatomitis]|uniref:Uncharacterized protein n=1 Tax=Penicillium diatomitis TaxID=2819901 RepID=A0A9X0C0D9_9EURO|nr:uncharacterized protein N7539_002223 [Penicillium diatomitis]KAJ5493477.1 hypothetical protein N7539_002223 [Penicillium diatomitis]